MSNHTPGPWKRNTRSWGGEPYWVVEDQTGAIICQAEVGFHEYESGSFITVEEEIAANVNLISAGPGLLEIAREVAELSVWHKNVSSDCTCLACRARAAVARVKGDKQ